MAYFSFLEDIWSGFHLSMLNYIDMYTLKHNNGLWGYYQIMKIQPIPIITLTQGVGINGLESQLQNSKISVTIGCSLFGT